ncbi:MAG: DUF4339 domain-containing protein [Verrucomicrobiota bacterium]
MIHIARNGKQEGPYTLDQVNALVASGRLRLEDSSWWEGCDGWVPVSRIPGLAAAGSAAGMQSVYAAPGSVITPVSHGAVSAEAVQALRETRPWVLLIAVMGMIGTALMLLGGLGMLAFASMGTYSGRGGNAGVPFILAAVYLVAAVIYLYPLIKLFKYARAISALSRTGASVDLENALRQQKSFWKFVGILFLIGIVIYVVALVVVGGAAFTGAMRGFPSSGGGTFPPVPSTP